MLPSTLAACRAGEGDNVGEALQGGNHLVDSLQLGSKFADHFRQDQSPILSTMRLRPADYCDIHAAATGSEKG